MVATFRTCIYDRKAVSSAGEVTVVVTKTLG